MPTLSFDGDSSDAGTYTDNDYMEVAHHYSLNFEYKGTFFVVGQDSLLNNQARFFSKISINNNSSISLRSNGGSPLIENQYRINTPINSSSVSRTLNGGALHVAQDNGVIRIGAQKVNGTGAQRFLDDNISEMIMYSRLLSSSEIEAVFAYLKDKWNID